VALIVIHGDDEIVRTVGGAEKDGVGRNRAFTVDARRAAGFDCGEDEALVFGAEESVLACMWIEAADSDTRVRFAKELHGFVAKFDGADDARGIEVAGLAQADVRGDVHDAEALTGEQHA
jgi:hypothetical protein